METSYCDALRFALDYEKEGEKNYREAERKANSELSRRTLRFLADEEVEHIRKIERFNSSLIGENAFDLDVECSLTLPDRIKEFIADVHQSDKLQTGGDLSDIDIYNAAMSNEQTGYDLYKRFKEETDDARIERFFGFLVSEEEAHYGLLSASKKYLEDPSYYFEEGGGWLFG